MGKALVNINASLFVIKHGEKARGKKIKGWKNSIRKAEIGAEIME